MNISILKWFKSKKRVKEMPGYTLIWPTESRTFSPDYLVARSARCVRTLTTSDRFTLLLMKVSFRYQE